MIAAIEFLYTGCIVTQQLTWASAFKIIHASRYLLLDNLRDYVMTYLEMDLLKVKMKGEFAAWCLTELAESAIVSSGKHLLQHSLSARLVWSLVSKVRLQNVDPYSTNHLSLSAFSLYLDATQSVNDTNIPFWEYFRLRCILLWACTRLSPMIEGDLRKCLPDEKWLWNHSWDALDGLDCSRTLATSCRAMALEVPDSRLQIRSWIEKLEQGWSSVNLDCIHPMLLSKVVEPLGIIPESLLLSAYRNQAVNASNMILMTWDKGDNEDVEILESGTMLRRAANPAKAGFTNVHSSMPINHGLCQWDLIVEGQLLSLYIGLAEKKHSKSSSGSGLGSWCRWLCSSGYLYGEGKHGKYCPPFERAQRSEVRIRVDMALRSCAFTIDGKDYGTAWSDSPDEVYPHIAIGKSQVPVTVRIKRASDVWNPCSTVLDSRE